jgi:hypothetical protein
MVVSVTDTIMSRPPDLVQGTLHALLLQTLALEPLHGLAVAQRLRARSGDVLNVSRGSLYVSDDVALATVVLPTMPFDTSAARNAFYNELGRRLLARPGVRAVAAGTSPPLAAGPPAMVSITAVDEVAAPRMSTQDVTTGFSTRSTSPSSPVARSIAVTSHRLDPTAEQLLEILTKPHDVQQRTIGVHVHQ